MFLVPPELVAAFDERVVKPIQLVHIDWPGGAVYIHDGVGTVSYLNEIWYGVAGFGEIGEITSDSNIGSHTVPLNFSGIDPKTLSEVVTRNVVNRSVDIYIGALDENNEVIAASPRFYGRISSTAIKRYGGDAISIEAVSKTSDWSKSRPNRYTDDSYRADHPNDDFLQYIAEMADRALYWNSPKDSTPLSTRK